MNTVTTRGIWRSAGLLAGAMILGILAGRFLFAPSGAPTPSAQDLPGALPKTEATKALVWTCSMHPQIRQPEPGKCPICAMELIPLVSEAGGAEEGPRTLVMGESALALAEIQTSRVERRFPELRVRLVGQIDYDETRLRSLSARFPARIEELYVNYTGVKVTQGEHLAQIYSPELITAQRELLSAQANDPEGPLARVARSKLLLWGLLPEQVDGILASGKVSDTFELRAPSSGIVITKNIKEGDYIKTGDPLFRIADLEVLWLHLQSFETDLAKLHYGQTVDFTVEAWPGETFSGIIAFIAPEVDKRTRTVAVRVNVTNVGNRLKPGMFAKGQVRVKLGAKNAVFAPDLAGKWISPMHPEIVKDAPGACDVCGMPLVSAESLGYSAQSLEQAPLVVPSSALLRTGKRAVVYVKKVGAKTPAFEGREVVLGAEAESVVIIASGLKEGEEVVTHGAFKIDSALQILAKASMMSAAPAPQANTNEHSNAADSAEAEFIKSGAKESQEAASATKPSQPEVTPLFARTLLPGYFKLQSALASDDLMGAKKALAELMTVSGHEAPLASLLHGVMGSDNLDTIREPVFATLSATLIQALKKDPAALEGAVLRMHCPMAMDNQGADWLQNKEPLRNPYFGSDMLTCGELVERLK